MEATCMMDFSYIQPGGTHAAHPGDIDAITQLRGFMVNTQYSINLEEEVYIVHRWDSLQVYEEIGPEEPYHVHIKMHCRDAEFYYGDATLLQGNKVVAFVKRVTVSDLIRFFDGHPQRVGPSSVPEDSYGCDKRLHSQGRWSYTKSNTASQTYFKEQCTTSGPSDLFAKEWAIITKPRSC